MVSIRKLDIADYEALCSLWQESGLPYRPNGRDTRQNIALQIEGDCSIYLVAEDKKRIIGSILATHDGRKGWLNRLAVSPNYRKRGIARMLVQEAEKRLLSRGIEIFACQIEDWNQTSMSVFENLGYTKHNDITYFSKRLRPDV
jgi:ribosomal protein S18 acetylase RimI-like enzyme